MDAWVDAPGEWRRYIDDSLRIRWRVPVPGERPAAGRPAHSGKAMQIIGPKVPR
jgi:hypothetical protein